MISTSESSRGRIQWKEMNETEHPSSLFFQRVIIKATHSERGERSIQIESPLLMDCLPSPVEVTSRSHIHSAEPDASALSPMLPAAPQEGDVLG